MGGVCARPRGCQGDQRESSSRCRSSSRLDAHKCKRGGDAGKRTSSGRCHYQGPRSGEAAREPYTIMFAAPVAAEGQVREPKASVNRSPPGQTKASVNRSPPGSGGSGGKGEKAFGMFSSGLG